jgi:PAS domain S-box-containing protein
MAGFPDFTRHRTARWRSIAFTEAPDPLFLLAPDGRFREVNEAACRQTGYHREALLAKRLEQIVEMADVPRVEALLREIGEAPVRFEARIRRPGGPAEPVEILLRRSPTRRLLIGTMNDLGEAEKAAALQRAMYAIAAAASTPGSLQELYGKIHAIIAGLMPARNFFIARYDDMNKSVTIPYFADEVDYIPNPYVARPLADGLIEYILRSETPLIADKARMTALQEEGALVIHGTMPDSLISVPLRIGERVIGMVAVQSYSAGERYTREHLAILDFVSGQMAMSIQRKVMEEALRESEEKYYNIFQRSAVSMWEADISSLRSWLKAYRITSGAGLRSHMAANEHFIHFALLSTRVVDVNDATVDLFEAESKDQLLGPLDITMTEESMEGFANAVAAIAEGRRYHEGETTARTLRGKKLHVVTRYYIPDEGDQYPHMLMSILDVSERMRADEERARLEQQLRQAQKMESIGRLAGGVAHDFNNMLAPIIGFSEMLLEEPLDGEQRREDLRQILGAAERARDLTRQLLAFGRKQILTLEPIDLRDVVAGFERLLRRTIREDIRIEISLPSTPTVSRADAGQIEQVLLNLAVNAQDAMPQGGSLGVRMDVTTVEAGQQDAMGGVAPGSYVLLSVSDTGLGMGPEIREHLFEPFFTTKERGKGTGLGLSTAYGIVKQHGGGIVVDSEPGRGSTFRILLPRESMEPVRAAEAGRARDRVPRGTETILVAEDTAAVRSMVAAMLERLGYSVIATENAEEALRVGEKETGRIHLLLTDVVMPGVNGRELYLRLSGIRPELKVLFMSGYAGEMIARHGVLEEGTAFIQKPFTLEILARKVRDLLDRHPGQQS